MTISTTATIGNTNDVEYRDYLARIAKRFLENTTGQPVFTTDATGLYDALMAALPADERPFHECRACRSFVDSYGGLVTISEDGSAIPAVWDLDDCPDVYMLPTVAMVDLINKANVNGVFISPEKVYGRPVTGEWLHLSVYPDPAAIHRSLTQSASQRSAEKREDYKNVSAALGDFTVPVLDQAIRLLESEALYRSEKVLGAATWLRDLQTARNAVHGPARANVLWRAIATAPAGFCHPRSSMIGTLLEDIAAGKDFAEVSRAFAAKMHPLQYQRPQAAPKSGTIAQAEKIVEQLGASGALARRFMRADEVQPIWTPKADKPAKAGDGVFSHLKPHQQVIAAMAIPATKMTWEKFNRTVLPAADRIELQVPVTGTFCTLVTAVNPEAPPILQWDSEEARNPASWYVWHRGSPASQYGLPGGQYVDVVAVTLKPCQWGSKPMAHQGEGAVFVLKGARETRSAGAALFPEILKAEMHGVRSVIEAFSLAATMENVDGDHAVGPLLSKGSALNTRVRVTSNGQQATYDIDRWD